MNVTFAEYKQAVLEQLDCNATQEYKEKCIVYLFTNEQIEQNQDYFQSCLSRGLSPYKALLYFSEYLEGNYTPLTFWEN